MKAERAQALAQGVDKFTAIRFAVGFAAGAAGLGIVASTAALLAFYIAEPHLRVIQPTWFPGDERKGPDVDALDLVAALLGRQIGKGFSDS